MRSVGQSDRWTDAHDPKLIDIFEILETRLKTATHNTI